MNTSLIGKIINRAPVNLSRGDSLFSSPTSPRPGATSSLSAMGAQATVFSIVDRIAQDAGTVQWQLFPRKGTVPAPHRIRPTAEKPITRHPALTVWDQPNPATTGQEFRESTIQHFELVGEMPWVVGRSRRAPTGPPIELWAVRPDRIKPVSSKWDFIRGWVYGVGMDETPLRLDQVLFTKRPNPMNPYRGIGPIQTLLMDLEGEQAAAAFNTMFFRNGAEPGGMIETDRTLSDPEFEQLVERWNQTHKGVSNSHRVAILENAKWVDRKFSARDMQFEQLRRYTRDTIRGAWGFPKPLLGDVEDVNRANAEAADAVFAKHILRPRLDRIRGTLNQDFLPMFGGMGEGVEFDYVDPVEPDPAEMRLDLQNRMRLLFDAATAGFDTADISKYLELPDFGYDAPVYVEGTAAQQGDEDPPADDDDDSDDDSDDDDSAA